MGYSITASVDGKYVVIKVEGTVTRHSAMQWVLEAHALGRQLQIHRYLVDVTRARNTDPVIENYDFAYVDMQSGGFDRSARTATLAAPDDASHDFVATAIGNAGGNFKLFKDREQAMRFLTADDGPGQANAAREITRPPEKYE